MTWTMYARWRANNFQRLTSKIYHRKDNENEDVAMRGQMFVKLRKKFRTYTNFCAFPSLDVQGSSSALPQHYFTANIGHNRSL